MDVCNFKIEISAIQLHIKVLHFQAKKRLEVSAKVYFFRKIMGRSIILNMLFG